MQNSYVIAISHAINIHIYNHISWLPTFLKLQIKQNDEIL